MKFYRIQKDDYIKLYFYSVYFSRIVTFCDKKIKKIKNLNEIKKFHPMINNKYSCHRLTYISRYVSNLFYQLRFLFPILTILTLRENYSSNTIA